MERGLELHEAAVRLQEKHAEHARKLGNPEMARRAADRAERAKARADLIRRRTTTPGATLPGT